MTKIFLKEGKTDFLSSRRSWFFTNERLNNFLKNSFTHEDKLKKVLAVGGSGDFIFNLTSLLNIEKIDICDTEITAISVIDLKTALFKEFNRIEMAKIYSNFEINNKNKIYLKINRHLHPASRHIFENIFSHCQNNNFLKCLKKSKFWHKDSFFPGKHQNDYILYLASPEGFKRMLNHLDKINIFQEDLIKTLILFKENYYDLIYVSNVLDGKSYCENKNLYLNILKQSLKRNAHLLLATCCHPSKIKKTLENIGLKLDKEELHKFKLIDSLKGHYNYSFLLFKNI